MHHFWEHMIAPIFPLLQPKHIVEIGAKDGRNTARIAQYCRENNATLYCIDIAITPELQAVLTTYSDVIQFYETDNLSVLPNIQQLDLILVNDNLDWHSVLNELQALTGKPSSLLPILLLQDTPNSQEQECQQSALKQERDSALRKQEILQEKLLIMRERVSHFEKQISYISCSRSWRFTAPLRNLGIFLRKLRR